MDENCCCSEDNKEDVCETCCLCVKVWDEDFCADDGEIFEDDDSGSSGLRCLLCVLAVLCWPVLVIFCISTISKKGKCCSCRCRSSTRGVKDSNKRHQATEPVWMWNDLINKPDHSFSPYSIALCEIGSVLTCLIVPLWIWFRSSPSQPCFCRIQLQPSSISVSTHTF